MLIRNKLNGFTRTLLLSGLFVFIAALSCAPASAQQTFYAFYENSADTTGFRQDLSRISSAGFSGIVFQNNLSPQQVSILENFDFYIIQSLGLQYQTAHSLSKKNLQQVLGNVYAPYFDSSIFPDEILLYSYSSFGSKAFAQYTIQAFLGISGPPFTALKTLRQSTSDNLPIAKWIDIIDSNTQISSEFISEIGARIFYKPVDDHWNLRKLQLLIQQISSQPDGIVFLDWQQFLSQSENEPTFSEVIAAYSTDPDAIFPNPTEQATRDGNTFLSVVFLLIWIAIAILIIFYPPYLPSLLRYLQTHNFFMTDIMERRIRIASPNTYLLFLWSVLGGVVLYVFLFERLSTTGLQALAHQIQLNSIPSVFAVFVAGALFVTVLNGLFLLWIYLSHADIKHFSQIAVFQFWPQHILLLIASLAIMLVLMDAHPGLIDLSVLFFFGFVLLSFLFTVFDIARNLPSTIFFYLVTVLLFVILLTVAIVTIVIQGGLVEAIQLARNL